MSDEKSVVLKGNNCFIEMHELSGESTAFNSDGKTVPNGMSDNMTPNLNGMTVQEGENLNTTNSMTTETKIHAGHHEHVPMYAVDNNVQQFEIPDPILRRAFSLKVFKTLLIQHILILPIIEIFIFCFDPLSYGTIEGIRGLIFIFFIAIYFFSDMRRYPPMNIVTFIIVTLLKSIEAGILATWIQSQLALFPHLIIIAQFLAIIGYSEQDRYKFTVFNASLVVLLVSVACHYLLEVISPFSDTDIKYGAVSFTTYEAAYIVYDIHLMLSGHHGYKLQPNEHIFAATNVYADFVNFCWRIVRFFTIKPVVTMYRFLKRCCFAEVY